MCMALVPNAAAEWGEVLLNTEMRPIFVQFR